MFRLLIATVLVSACASTPPETASNSPTAQEAANRAHQEKIARLRVTNPELFRERTPEEARLISLEERYELLCDPAGWNKTAQLKRRFLRLELETYNQGNKVKCLKLERDLRAAYGLE